MNARNAALVGILWGAVACKEEPETGFAFDVTLTGHEDDCAGGDALEYVDDLEYVVYFDDSAARVAVDVGGEPVTFATGEIAGCSISYASVVWDDSRDGHTIRWRLEGEANWRTSGDLSCGLEPGIDWQGKEFVIVTFSDHPDYRTGCTVELDVVGSYAGER